MERKIAGRYGKRSYVKRYRYGVRMAALVGLLTLAMATILPLGQVPRAQDEEAPVLTDQAQNILRSVSRLPQGSVALWSRLSGTLGDIVESVEAPTRGKRNTEVYKKAVPAVVYVQTDKGSGSGALIKYQGQPVVVTNWHVIEGAKGVAVVLKPEGTAEIKKNLAFMARISKVNEEADLAFLEIVAPPDNLSTLPLGEIAIVEVGQDVHAIGHPYGQLWTYTTGIVSQIRPNYEWITESQKRHKSAVIQTQTPIDPGNSGGPLLNDHGEIVGINSFRREGSSALNYAVSVDAIKALLNQETIPSPAPGGPTYPGGIRQTPQTEIYGNIVGMYFGSQSPPPDVWYVVNNKGETNYGVAGKKDRMRLDIVVVGTDPDWRAVNYYIDSNCDGVIDLIGLDSNGDDQIDRYRAPEQAVALASRAPEFTQALLRGALPYPELRLCTPSKR